MALYQTLDEAGRAALTEANPVSIRVNRELRGYLYRTAEGLYGYTFPMVGGIYRTSLDNIHIPPDTTRAGEYHTHGDYTGPDRSGASVRTTRENAWRGADIRNVTGPAADLFGPDDIPGARERGGRIPGYRSYLGTPSGIFYYYDVGTNTIGTL